MSLSENDVESILDELRPVLSKMVYRDTQLFNLTKLSLYTVFKSRGSQRVSYISSVLHNLALSLWIQLRGFYVRRSGWRVSRFIFVVDHYRDDVLAMLESVLGHFNKNDITIVTRNRKVYRALLDVYPNIFLSKYAGSYSIRALFERGTAIGRIIHRLARSRLGLRSTIETATVCSDGMVHLDRYMALLDSGCEALVTLCDVHMHEHAITSVANLKGIRTYTLQHGMIERAFIPVISDTIFAWGETSKRELVMFGVPDDKIAISGRLLLDEAVRSRDARVKEIRSQFAARYGFDESKVIISYFATNWGPDENRGLFDTFSAVLDFDVCALVKIRPNSDELHREQYRSWLRRRDVGKSVPVIFNEEDVFDIFSASDILITCHSGAAVEAMVFHTVSVILDLYDYMDLPTILPHYDDCYVARSKQQLLEFVELMITDRADLLQRQKEAYQASRKYFYFHENTSASKYVADQIKMDASPRFPV